MTYSEIKEFKALDLPPNELKSIIQHKAINHWLKNYNGLGVFEMYTGFGKTYTGEIIVNRFMTKNPDGKIIVLVPAKHLQVSWRERLSMYKNIEVYVLNTYTVSDKEATYECDLLIIDELHHVLGDSKYFSTAIQRTKFKYLIGFTAKLNTAEEEYLNSLNLRVCYKIQLIDGMKLGLVPNFKILNLGVDFTQDEKVTYYEWEKIYQTAQVRMSPIFSRIGKDVKLSDLARWYSSRAEKYVIHSNIFCKLYDDIDDPNRELKIPRNELINTFADYLDTDYTDIAQMLYFVNKSIMEREKMVGTAIAKMNIAKEFIETNKKKSIIFGPNNIKSCETLISYSKNSDTVMYNSNVSTGKRKKILEVFKNDGFRNLLAIKALDEGLDIPNVQMGLIMHLVGKASNNLQRLGRILRYDPNDPDKMAVLIYLYVNKFTIYDQETEDIVEVTPIDNVKLKAAQKELVNVYDIKSLKEYESLCNVEEGE